jgi:predicted TIM-barrel fold metal-dependent hydrolase
VVSPLHRLAPVPGATDTHVHVFDPRRFAYAPDRSYTPGAATLDGLAACHTPLGVDRWVLVQPSVYGTDNHCLLDAVKQAGQARCRAIAVVDLEQVSEIELDDLHAGGVRGIRLNLAVRHEADRQRARDQFLQAAHAITRPGWCVQVHCSGELLGTLAEVLDAFQVSVVLDHYGGLHPSTAHDGHPALQALLRLLASGRVFVKLSADYRASETAEPHNDLAPLVRRLTSQHADRLLWGSDWPHTGGANRDPAVIEPFRSVDLSAALARLRIGCGDASVFEQILVHNPAHLYGFDAHPSTPTPLQGVPV